MNSKLNPYVNLLMTMPLFAGIESRDDIVWLLNCIDAKPEQYKAGDQIVSPGESLYFGGMVISGTLQAEENGEIHNLDAGAMIPVPFETGKAYAEATVSVTAKTDATVLMMRWIRMSQICNFQCKFHQQYIQNLTKLMKRHN